MGLFYDFKMRNDHRPDLRNYCLKDLMIVKYFESITDNDELIYLSNIHSKYIPLLYIFGAYFSIDSADVLRILWQPWHEPITQSYDELAKLDLPFSSINHCGTFSDYRDKHREGLYDLGFHPLCHYIYDGKGWDKVEETHVTSHTCYTEVDGSIYYCMQFDRAVKRI